jgi:2'-5' RNA ligase
VPRVLACLFLPAPADVAIRRLQIDVAGYRPLLPPHVTLAPPTDGPFPITALRAACREVGALDLVIGPPGSFATSELVAYLEVGGPGRVGFGRLHRALGGTGAFVPHVTLVRGRPKDTFDQAMAAAADMRWPVRVDVVQVVSMTRDGSGWRWEPYETLDLEKNATLS